MALNRICRTCDVSSPAEVVRLDSCPKKYCGKRLLDLLIDVTKIDVELEYLEKLPHNLCTTCTRKLRSAYDFVIQARETNKDLVDIIKATEFDSKPHIDKECLRETPMEVCTEQFLEVKLEEHCQETATELVDSLIKENQLEEESQEHDADKSDNNHSLDPLVMTDKYNSIANKEEQEKPCIGHYEKSSSDELDELPLQQRRFKLKQADGKLSFKSDRKSLRCVRKRSHLGKLHKQDEPKTLKRTSTLSQRKQAKAVDSNLCKPHGCKLIQCMICLQKYAKISDLRSHLNEHPDISALSERSNETLQEIADSFFVDCKNATEEELIMRIRKDLSTKKFDNYYSITNQSGYELSLSTSETESEIDAESEEETCNVTRKSYTCELCNGKYLRKYQLFDHQKQHDCKDAVYVCKRCNVRFVNKDLLEHHYKSQCRNAQKRFTCRKCPLRFRWKHNLKTHYREHRKKIQTYECIECKRIYDDKRSLTLHMLTVHTDESKLMPCHWCNRKFYRRDYMLKHLKRHGIREHDLALAKMHVIATSTPNGDKIIQCIICNIQFDRICDLKEHILLELKLNLTTHQSYESLTNYRIRNESGFELHLDDSETDEEDSIETKQMSYKCEICQIQCKRKFEMFQHQRSMHRFEQLPHSCEKCIFKCVSKEILDHHRSTQCFNEQKKLSCEKCSYKFMWPENLTRHILIQHPDKTVSKISTEEANINISKEFVSETDATIQLQCPHCDKSYQLQGRLNNHIRDVHIDGDKKKKDAERKYLCSLCGKESQSAANLVTHMRRHTGEKPFKCDMCEMAFPLHFEMMQHRRKHTGEKPYHCTVCGKDFARSDKLKRHMLTHSGLRPHKCTFCEKCYRQSKDLKLHLLQHTGETHFECSICNERFIQSIALEKHRIMRGHFKENT